MDHRFWPFFDLRVRTEHLELGPDGDEGLVALAELAAGGIHEPDTMPFFIPWSDAPPGELERNLLQWHWRQRAELSPQRWSLCFIVSRVHDGRIVGTQGLQATDFAKTPVVATGSRLAKPFSRHR